MDLVAKSHHQYLVLVLMVTSFGLCLAQTSNSTDILLANISQKLDALTIRLKLMEYKLQSQCTPGGTGTTCSCCPKPRDCVDLRAQTNVSGVYTIYVGFAQRPLSVYCDMTTDGGGWTVFQRRQDGSVDFYKGWNDYAAGFGNPSGEFWLGNENIYALTDGLQHKLRVDLMDFSGNTRYAVYDNFKMGAARYSYLLLSLGAYSGTAGDSMTSHLGYHFSTYDNDRDRSYDNCAIQCHGAWWYHLCHSANLNGFYYSGPTANYCYGVEWRSWLGYYESLKFTEMKIRLADI